jgi:hypothetical protein
MNSAIRHNKFQKIAAFGENSAICREKRVLVLGAGYFGRLLIDDLLLYADCDLIVASRRPFRSARFETAVADLWDPRSLERVLIGVEVTASLKRRVSIAADFKAERMAVMPPSIMTSLLLSGAQLRGLVSPANWLTREHLTTECMKRGFRLIVEEL